MFERFSDQARAAVAVAIAESGRLSHPHVGTEHLLLGLLSDRESGAGRALHAAGATLDGARHKIVETRPAAAGGASAGAVADLEEPPRPYTPRARRALERAGRFSLHRRAERVQSEHVLLGVLDVEGTAGQVLRGLGVDIAALASALDAATADEPATTAPGPTGDESLPAPKCPACAAPLDASLAVRGMAARTAAGGERDVLVAFCGRCGTSLGVWRP